MIEARRPPGTAIGASAWLRRNLFGSLLSSVATVLIAALAALVVYNLLSWIIVSASWQQLWNNLKLFAVYRYPADLLGRPLSVVAMLMALLGVTSGAARGGSGKIVRGVFVQLLVLVVVLAILRAMLFPGDR